MGFDRIRIKENAKTHYELNKWNNVLVILIYTLVSGGVSVVEKVGDGDKFGLAAAMIGIIGSVASLFVTSIIFMGVTVWFQRAIHREKLDVGEMFCAFKEKYTDNVLLVFLKGLFVFLWTLLFVVPGIIKAYSYSMAEYIKMENPNISPSRAIDISKAMTEGHKMDLFVLDLSFFGWHMLSALTFGILEVVYVGPYYYAAKAFAYEEIKAEAIASGRVDAGELGGYSY
ncbi:MAG: DUF975 family protein [Oscillospiraceae bacterium]